MRKAVLATALAAALLLPLAAQAAERVQHGSIFPPWQHGENNDAAQRGLSFTAPPVDSLADFHGDVSDPKLVLYVGGNYFFAWRRWSRRLSYSIPSSKAGSNGKLYRPVSSKSRSMPAGPLPPAT